MYYFYVKSEFEKYYPVCFFSKIRELVLFWFSKRKTNYIFLDPADILKENSELRDMLLCRGCKLLEGTFANISCGHLMCSNCCEVLKTCRLCRKEIKDVIPILFWTNQTSTSCKIINLYIFSLNFRTNFR